MKVNGALGMVMVFLNDPRSRGSTTLHPVYQPWRAVPAEREQPHPFYCAVAPSFAQGSGPPSHKATAGRQDTREPFGKLMGGRDPPIFVDGFAAGEFLVLQTMKILFEPMTRPYAKDIASWRYDPPYDIYGRTDEEEDRSIDTLVDEKNSFFAALHNGELIGFRSFGDDGRVSGGNYDGPHLDTGGGLRPDLSGKGLGAEVIYQGLQFGSKTFGTKKFRVTIAGFNQRAQKVCRRLGFQESDRFHRTKDGNEFVIMTLGERVF